MVEVVLSFLSVGAAVSRGHRTFSDFCSGWIVSRIAFREVTFAESVCVLGVFS